MEGYNPIESSENNEALLRAILKISGEESTILRAFYKKQAEIMAYGDVQITDRELLAQKAEETAEQLRDMGYTINAEQIQAFSLESEDA